MRNFLSKIFRQSKEVSAMDRALHKAALEHEWEEVKNLLDLGANAAHDNSFVLAGAVLFGQADVAELALKKGARLQDNNFEAYQWARVREIEQGDTKTLKVLTDWAKDKKIKLPVYARDKYPERYPTGKSPK